MFVQPFYFVSYYFYWIEYDFFFHFQETYNSQLRERYGDDPSTHPDFDPNLWMEVGSSGGPDKNRVYGGLSNTTAENLRPARSVSTVGSSQLVSSTQSKEFVALQQHTAHLTKQYEQLSANYEQNTAYIAEKYEQLSVNYEQLRQMVMDMQSQSGDTCAPSSWPYGPRNNQPPPPPPLAPPLC
jgi:hypothetical protein